MTGDSPPSNNRKKAGWLSCCSSEPDAVVVQQKNNNDGDNNSSTVIPPLPSRPRNRATIVHVGAGGGIVTQQQFDSEIFFDAQQSEIGDDEDDFFDVEMYPVHTTTSVKSKPKVTFDQPETMLGHDAKGGLLMSQRDLLSSIKSQRGGLLSSSSSSSQPSRSLLIKTLTTGRLFRSSRQMQLLTAPRIATLERGFPGGLSPDELDQCLELIRFVRKADRPYAEQIYSLREVEDEPYALCRFLRGCKFDVNVVIKRLEDGHDYFWKAKEKNFYPDVESALQAPIFPFMQQYPFVTIGRARNGCPVNYFRCGQINPEGIFSLTSLEGCQGFMWNQSYHNFKKNMKNSKAVNPDVVRMETINVFDLEGLSYSVACSTEASDTLKLASTIGDYFPETMHCMIIVNAPGYFSILWGIIKNIINPRTAKRIQVFSNKSKGLERLRELIEESEIPSDYGGTHASFEESMQKLLTDCGSTAKRHDNKLMCLKKKETQQHEFQLDQGELLTVQIYTRTAAAAQVTLYRNDEAKDMIFDSKIIGKEAGEAYAPSCTLVGKDLHGPGTYVLEARDLNESPPHSLSRGYFHVIGEIH